MARKLKDFDHDLRRKLTREDRTAIIWWLQCGVGPTYLGNKYGVSRGTIHNVGKEAIGRKPLRRPTGVDTSA